MASVPRIDAERLNDFGAAVYASAGVPEADARFVADTLVQADLWGHQSHGVLRLGWYLERLLNKVMKPVTQAETVVDAGTIAVIDGHDGVGQVLTADAAQTLGVKWATLATTQPYDVVASYVGKPGAAALVSIVPLRPRRR